MLLLHLLWCSAHHIRHCGIGAPQPRHQPLGTAVALKGVAAQVAAGKQETESCQTTGQRKKKNVCHTDATYSSMRESKSMKISLGRNLMWLFAKDLHAKTNI